MASIFTPNDEVGKYITPKEAPAPAPLTDTPTLGLTKPNVGGDADAWGQMINDNFDKIDANAATVNAGIANATFPVGTRSLFQQTTAPTGWTKDASQDNKALRVVGGAAGSGGTMSFTECFAARAYGSSTDSQAQGGIVGDTALSWAQMPPHAHNFNDMGGRPGNAGSVGLQYSAGSNLNNFNYHASVTDTQGQGAPHGHTFSPYAHAHGFYWSVDFSVQYVDVIICVKN